MPSANDFFVYLEDWKVAVCTECHYAVDQVNIFGHLVGDKHDMPKKEAEAIAAEVVEWPGLIAAASFEPPLELDEPISCLHLYIDGLACNVEASCIYICRTHKTMKTHWKDEHNFTLNSGRGGSGPAKEAEKRAQLAKGLRAPVLCQRFFISGSNSRFFEVKSNGADNVEQALPVGVDEALTRAWARAGGLLDTFIASSADAVADPSRNEVNPWLERTGWVKFFQGVEKADILESIQAPDKDSNDDMVKTAIWRAMKDVACISQVAVQNSGNFVNFEAIRCDLHQTEYRPLRAYQHEDKITKHCLPWQQILMFVVRCNERRHSTGIIAPLTLYQQKAYEELMEAASEEVETAITSHEDRVLVESRDLCDATDMTRLQNACLEMCIALLDHKIKRHEYESPVVRALAALGCSSSSGGWREPDGYTSTLSSVIKISQFMVVCKAVRDTYMDDADGYAIATAPTAAVVTGNARRRNSAESTASVIASTNHSCIDIVRLMVERFMMRGTSSPMQWAHDLRAYGMKLAINTTRNGSVSWQDGDRLLYQHFTFTMDKFRKLVHELTATASTLLARKVVMTGTTSDLPPIDWDHLFDDPSNTAVGWNFTHDTRSRFPCEGRMWLFNRFVSSTALRQRFARENSAGGLNRSFVMQWLSHVESFREKLLLLMHITGGQPARGTELLSLRHSNTASSGQRNLFIENGAVVYVTRYHKGYAISGDFKIIHRYLPREVGQLVVWYIWLVLPFVERMEVLLNQSHRPSPLLWPEDYTGKGWCTDRITALLRIETGARLGCELNFATYRHMAIAIGRRFLKHTHSWEEDERDVGTLQERLTQIMDEQAGHSSHIAGLVYARELEEMVGVLQQNRQRFRLVSEEWHRCVLNFESANSSRGKLKRQSDEWAEAEADSYKRRKKLCVADPTEQLHMLLGNDACFRSRQEDAIREINRGTSPIVAVMPTAAGKSLLYLLPALAAGAGTTVVIVPLKSLRADALEHCRQHGIKASVWADDCQLDGESIVFVTPEAALLGGFGDALNRLQRTRQLDRIVIDECHVLLAQDNGFRSRITELCGLARAQTQMVLLTATLPPTEERQLLELMGWYASETTVIRASTVRPNIKYEVRYAGSNRERLLILQTLITQVRKRTAGTRAQVVIYYNSRKRVEEAAQELGARPFHAGMKEPQKEALVKQLRAGTAGVVCATSALGMGIDVPNIRLVVHADEPRNLRDYAQESGRAGRDGERCTAIMLTNGEQASNLLVRTYMEGGCRRMHLDHYLDGDDTRFECSRTEVLCDFCEHNSCRDSSLLATAVLDDKGYGQAVCETSTTFLPTSSSACSARTSSSISHSAREGQETPLSVRTSEGSLCALDSSIETASLPRHSGKQQPVPMPLALVREHLAGGRSDQDLTIKQMRLQDHRRSIPIERQRDRVAEENRRAGTIPHRILLWQSRCLNCVADRRNGNHTPFESCIRRGTPNTVTQWTWLYQKRLQYPKYCPVCYCCGVPRRVCDRFDAEGRTFLGPHMKCQFNNVIHRVVASLQAGFPEWWDDYLHVHCARYTSGKKLSDEEVLLLFLKDTTPSGSSTFLFDAFLYLIDRYEELCNDEQINNNGGPDGDEGLDGDGGSSRILNAKVTRRGGGSSGASVGLRKSEAK